MTTPLNANLSRIVLPTAAGDRLVKVLVVHDSQGLRQTNRWVGQTPKWNVQHVGAWCHSVNQQSAGVYYSEISGAAYGATITTTRKQSTDDWGDGNTSDHVGWGNEWDVAGTMSPNFSELGRYAIYDNGSVYTLPFDKDARKNARVLLRDESGAFARMRLSEYRSGSVGQSDDFGLAGDPVQFDGSGALRLLNWPIRAAGTLGSAGGNPVGVVVKDSNNLDTNRDLNILGALIYNSPSGEAFPTAGMILANIGHSGWSAYDHVNRQSSAVRTAMCAAMEGVDLIIPMLGHNAEDSGTYADNMRALIEAWNTTHAGMGYGNPDYLLMAPWASAASNMNASKVADLYSIAKSGNHGFINLHDSYGGLELDGRSEQLDGTPVTYSMDGSNLHPDDATTARAIAMDIEWHMQPENWEADLATSLRGRGRGRSRRDLGAVG